MQHIKLNESLVLPYLQRVWGSWKPGELLYLGSPSVFRRRWDRLLSLLGVPEGLGLTPASLRGVGAIAAFHKGLGINDLLWRMRLRSAATFVFYLQETAAVSILPKLPWKVRRKILSARCFFESLSSPAGVRPEESSLHGRYW